MSDAPVPDTGGACVDPGHIPLVELRRLYEGYRARQARALLGVIPNDAIRPLYRRAREELRPVSHGERAGGRGEDDPMALLLEYCASLLTLPTFDVWLEDLRANPEAHWRDVEASADTPSPTAPATLATRRFHRGLAVWDAHLRGFRDRDAWRGFIAFQDFAASPGRLHRTALIFREPTLAELRDRFSEFESASLEAFLRSSLP